MIYNPKSLSKSENLNKLEIGNVLHDGINYMVYESTNSVIKMYKGDVS